MATATPSSRADQGSRRRSPSNRKIPPLITIDHILTRNAAAESVRTINVPGSDHRALLATIRVPIDPPSAS